MFACVVLVLPVFKLTSSRSCLLWSVAQCWKVSGRRFTLVFTLASVGAGQLPGLSSVAPSATEDFKY
eukprot:g24164.t1